MKAIILMQKQDINIHKSIQYVEISNNILYATKKPYIIKIGKEISKIVQQIDQTRPTCGTQDHTCLSVKADQVLQV